MKQQVLTPARERLRFYLGYTILFGVLCILVFLPFLIYDKSFVWKNDGLSQHFNAFVYLGEYLRGILKTLFTEGRLVIPMWEFGIGYGADIITTLQYYVLGDPVAIFSIVPVGGQQEELYGLLILLRLYLSGVAFCAFCRKMDCGRYASMAASFAYVFCAFTIFAAVRHPYFASPMIYLPLILLGVEKIFRKESPVLYIVMIFVAAISNFYFFYMLVLLTILYAVFRFFSLVKENIWKNLGIYVAKFCGFALIGVAMAAVLFLPVVMAFLSDSRASTNYVPELLYTRSQYEAFLGSFVSDAEGTTWSYIGVGPVVLLGIGGLFLHRKQNGWLKGLFLLMTAFLLIPFAGYAFNGFGYVTNRWVFGYAFLCAFILAKTMPQLVQLSQKKKWALGAGAVVYTLLCMVLEKSHTEVVMCGCALLLVTLLFIFGIPHLPKISFGKLSISRRRVAQVGILILMVAGILNTSINRYSFSKNDYLSEFHNHNSSYPELTEQREATWELMDTDGFYRVDETPTGDTSEDNHFISSHQSTTVSYWSLTNSAMTDYMQLNSAYRYTAYMLAGLHSRTFLEPFAGVRYFVCESGQEGQVPYGFSYVGSKETFDGNTVKLYETQNYLPLGYTTSSWLTRSSYDNMSMTQRQQAMLQGAVIEDENTGALSALQEAQPVYTDERLDYQVVCDDDVLYEDGKFTVTDSNGKVTLLFDAPAACELYVQLTGLDFESHSKYDYYTEEDWKKQKEYQLSKINHTLRYWTEADFANITVACNGEDDVARFYTSHHNYAHNRTDYLFNLYYSEEGRTELTITFSQPGEYTFDELSVISQPMTGLEEQVAAMKEDTLEDVEISTNRITGNISLDTDKLLCFSIPYSQGWTLLVDGEETELLQTNVMYMGVPLTAGEHTIELRYTTPYLKVGLLLTGVGFAALIVLLIYRKVRRGPKGPERQKEGLQNHV